MSERGWFRSRGRLAAVVVTCLAVGLLACEPDVEDVVDGVVPEPVATTTTTTTTVPTGFGAGFTPANTPTSSAEDIDVSFERAAALGDHIRIIREWVQEPSASDLAWILDRARARDLAVHLSLSPIALDGGRNRPAIPASVGGTSFGDRRVRRAFTAKALELAALEPDVLGIGTEVNFLAANPTEFAGFVTMARETRAALRARYPLQTVTISFQWDEMVRLDQYDLLGRFDDALDIYSFTTYAAGFEEPDDVTPGYYADIRTHLPDARVGISEVGWSSAAPSSEAEQAELYARLPELFDDVDPEYVTLALLHDVRAFTGDLARLNATGVRRHDGSAKPSWNVVRRLRF